MNDGRAFPTPARTAGLTAITLVAFAGNSVLARAAVAGESIGALEFTAVRIAAGALALAPFLARPGALRGRAPAALALAAYAVAFSIAYLALPSGTGALLLFGSVQVTMILAGLRGGERPRPARIVGFVVALAGLAWLVAPGVGAPAPWAAVTMAVAGIGWGTYSLLGRGVPDPVAATAGAFALAAPLVVPVALVLGDGVWATRGVVLGVVSGAVTSGLGYVLWYAALRGHTTISAAIVQLLVPAIAAFGGVLFLGETLDLRLTGSGLVTLGGVALAILAGRPRSGDRGLRGGGETPDG